MPDGHPMETKDEVLNKLRSGFPYHKNGPAQEYDWTEKEILEMAKHLETYSQEATSSKRKKIRAVRFDGTPVKGGLLRFVNDAKNGKTFRHNPYIKRSYKTIRAGQLTQHQLWHITSKILIAEFDYWTDVFAKNNEHVKNGQSADCKYPNINDLVFRHSDDFVGGLWSDFEEHWQRFVDEIRYLMYLLLISSFII